VPKSDQYHVIGEHRHLPAQLVLIAIAYRHPAHGDVIAQLDLKRDGRGNIAAGDEDYRTTDAWCPVRAGLFSRGWLLCTGWADGKNQRTPARICGAFRS
jgi:hypothetical protein